MMMSVDWELTLVLIFATTYKAPILAAAVKGTYWILMDKLAMVSYSYDLYSFSF